MNEERYSVERMQQVLLEAFKFVIDFCNRHDLRYILCGGSLLGAVRHEGFIPWDDDIDIYLYREDYNKLFTLKDELQSQGYTLQSLDDEGYFLSFAKITKNDTTIWEKDKFPYLLGVFIDVFPIDRFSCEDDEIRKYQLKARKLFRRYQTCVGDLSFKRIFQYFYSFRWVSCAIALSSKFNKRTQYLYKKKFSDFESQITDNKGEKCASITTAKGRVFRCEWFDEKIEGRFEDIDVLIPKGYDEYLTSLYGDYMQLPPEEKRVPAHAPKFLSFRKRYSLQEVKHLLEKGICYEGSKS